MGHVVGGLSLKGAIGLKLQIDNESQLALLLFFLLYFTYLQLQLHSVCRF